jgi:hypothetical protein
VRVAFELRGDETRALAFADRLGEGVVPTLSGSQQVDGKVFQSEVFALEEPGQTDRAQFLLTQAKRYRSFAQHRLRRGYATEEKGARQDLWPPYSEQLSPKRVRDPLIGHEDGSGRKEARGRQVRDG